MARSTKYDCDVLVVGAGLAGCWLALMVARFRPKANIRILDRATVGSGASSASAGFDAVESANPLQRALATRSRELYQQLSKDVQAAAVTRLPTYWVTHRSTAATFPSRFCLTKGIGVMPVRCDRNEIRPFNVDDADSLFFETESGYAYPEQICKGMVEYLLASHEGDLSLNQWTTFLDSTENEDVCSSRIGDGRTVRSRIVLIATGAFPVSRSSSRVVKPLLRRKKVGSVLIDRVPSLGDPAVVYSDLGCFFLPDVGRGKWTFSFTLESWDVPWRPSPTLNKHERLVGVELLGRLRPGFVAKIGQSRVAYDFYSQRGLPLALRLTPRTWFVGGFAGAGYRWAPAFVERFVTEELFGSEQLW